MRILNVTSSLDLKGGGGTAERTFQMSRSFARQGVQCKVLTLQIGLGAERVAALRPATVVVLECLWQRFYVPRFSWKIVRELVSESDVVHLIGHWGVLNALVYLAVRAQRKPYVVCPAGALPLFGRSAGLKRLYNLLVGNAIVSNAAGWIAVTSSEVSHFESYGIAGSNVTVIPNGVSEEDFPIADRAGFLRAKGLPDKPMILFMGRLNPIKGPDLLLEAFAMVSSRFPDHCLVFAGPDGGMLSDLKLRSRELKLVDRVYFLGHIDGETKAAAYQVARLLVVPSRQEAMSIVALEAGICGTPVLLTDQCGFGEILAVDPRLVVLATSEALAAGMLTLLENTDDLNEIGLRTKLFVQCRYAWSTIISAYIGLYRSILSPQSSV